ncbi:uncharacterized protein Dwil_GK17876, isoform B [Drosophila willistoni]|uniref:Uncharacterized protein, isoform B n=1 Tax=Drosophila willistoni TaxID=7260 RepID=A0A0Q9WZQ1_DROWI|nr:uncharacterized protein Dwil_GK17876, isoform B [Drosophila willistoni]
MGHHHHTLEVGKKRAADTTTDMFPLQFSGMVPFKRPAAEKSGIPVYQPGATTYQQLMQPFVPVSSQPERGVLYTTQCPMLMNGTFYIISAAY